MAGAGWKLAACEQSRAAQANLRSTLPMAANVCPAHRPPKLTKLARRIVLERLKFPSRATLTADT